jgi:hypothetical protein
LPGVVVVLVTELEPSLFLVTDLLTVGRSGAGSFVMVSST